MGKAWKDMTPEERQVSSDRARAWRLNNPDRSKAQYEAYRLRNPGKSTARTKEWRLKNPERHAAMRDRAKAKEALSGAARMRVAKCKAAHPEEYARRDALRSLRGMLVHRGLDPAQIPEQLVGLKQAEYLGRKAVRNAKKDKNC